VVSSHLILGIDQQCPRFYRSQFAGPYGAFRLSGMGNVNRDHVRLPEKCVKRRVSHAQSSFSGT